MNHRIETSPLGQRCDGCDEIVPAETPYFVYFVGESQYIECWACNAYLIENGLLNLEGCCASK